MTGKNEIKSKNSQNILTEGDRATKVTVNKHTSTPLNERAVRAAREKVNPSTLGSVQMLKNLTSKDAKMQEVTPTQWVMSGPNETPGRTSTEDIEVETREFKKLNESTRSEYHSQVSQVNEMLLQQSTVPNGELPCVPKSPSGERIADVTQSPAQAADVSTQSEQNE